MLPIQLLQLLQLSSSSRFRVSFCSFFSALDFPPPSPGIPALITNLDQMTNALVDSKVGTHFHADKY